MIGTLLRSRMQRLFYLAQTPVAQERCVPYHPCQAKARCLRFRAVPVRGVPLADHSILRPEAACDKFLPLPDGEKVP